MARFVISQDTDLDPDRAWARVTDWPRHTRYVPFTTTTVTTPPPPGLGAAFCARTGVGPVGFDDPMEVVAWEPPDGGETGRCRLEKRGRTVLGWAEITVAATSSGSRVTWTEEVGVAHVPRRLADRPIALGSRLMFGRVLRKLLE